jgi:hypothetical protein
MENIFIPIIFGSVVLTVFMLVAWWIVYTRAGKPGWACIIPIYNIIVLLEIVGKPWWWIFLMLVPFVNIVIAVIMYHNLSLSFGKGVGFTVGLLLLPIVFLPILAFGDAIYQSPAVPNP